MTDDVEKADDRMLGIAVADDDDERGIPKTAVLVSNGHFRELHGFVYGEADSYIKGQWTRYHSALEIDRIWAETVAEKPELAGRIRESMASLSRLECYVCGKRVTITCENPERYVVNEPCPFPGGMPAYDILLAVPSGRLAIANDLRPFNPIEEPQTSINHEAGTRDLVEAYARGGMAHFFVGNSCPGVYRRGNTLTVANYADEEWVEEEERATTTFVPVDQQGERVASVCTDLWWVSMMDEWLLKARAEEYDIELGPNDYDIVEVPPGTYAVTILPRNHSDDYTVVYARIEQTDRVAEPPVIFSAELAETLEQSQAYKAVVKSGRSVLGLEGLGQLEFILMVTGNGYDWRRGFPLCGNAGPEDPPIRGWQWANDPTPTFHPYMVEIKPAGLLSADAGFLRSKFYPLSPGYSLLGTTPANADPWWLALCLLFSAEAKDRYDLFEHPLHQTAMKQVLHYLCEVVERQGGYETIRPYVDDWSAFIRG